MAEFDSTSSPKPYKAVYTIVEREGLHKKFWIRIGAAFVNGDESLSVKLDAAPVNGTLHIRDAEPRRFANGTQELGEA